MPPLTTIPTRTLAKIERIATLQYEQVKANSFINEVQALEVTGWTKRKLTEKIKEGVLIFKEHYTLGVNDELFFNKAKLIGL